MCNKPDCDASLSGWGKIQMKIQAIAAMAVIGAALSGCASIVGEGSNQQIMVTTNPADASCDFIREGQSIGTIRSTPGALMVKRRKYDITIRCTKPGYAQAEFFNKSGLNSLIGGNIAADLILTAGISSIIDSSTGADNEYTGNVVLTMTPLSGAPPAPPATPTTVAPAN